jgi:hypothetical protein
VDLVAVNHRHDHRHLHHRNNSNNNNVVPPSMAVTHREVLPPDIFMTTTTTKARKASGPRAESTPLNRVKDPASNSEVTNALPTVAPPAATPLAISVDSRTTEAAAAAAVSVVVEPAVVA